MTFQASPSFERSLAYRWGKVAGSLTTSSGVDTMNTALLVLTTKDGLPSSSFFVFGFSGNSTRKRYFIDSKGTQLVFPDLLTPPFLRPEGCGWAEPTTRIAAASA